MRFFYHSFYKKVCERTRTLNKKSMKKIMFVLVAVMALMVCNPVEAQNVKKAKKKYEKEKALLELQQQKTLDSLERAQKIKALKNQETAVIMPCMDLQAPAAGVIRSNLTEGIGESSDMLTAGKQARSYAVASLASKIAISVANTSRGTLKDNAINDMRMNEKVFVDALKNTVMQEIQGYSTACEKFTQNDNGVYKCYVVVELNSNDVQKVYNRLSKDGVLRSDYNFEKFQKDLEEDIKKFEEKNK